LREQPNPVRVERHTDSRPISSSRFPSNWELSAARAARAPHLLIHDHVAPDRRRMVGYGEHRPKVAHARPARPGANRRAGRTALAAPDGPGARPAAAPPPMATLAPSSTVSPGGR